MEGPLNIERDVVKNGVRLDCVFEGYEYRPEREEVRSQRLAGFGCVEIAENTGLSLEQEVSAKAAIKRLSIVLFFIVDFSY